MFRKPLVNSEEIFNRELTRIFAKTANAFELSYRYVLTHFKFK